MHAAQRPCTRGQDREDLHGHHHLPLAAVVHGEEGDLQTAEHQHSEHQELAFIEDVRQVPGQESHHEA